MKEITVPDGTSLQNPAIGFQLQPTVPSSSLGLGFTRGNCLCNYCLIGLYYTVRSYIVGKTVKPIYGDIVKLNIVY